MRFSLWRSQSTLLTATCLKQLSHAYMHQSSRLSLNTIIYGSDFNTTGTGSLRRAGALVKLHQKDLGLRVVMSMHQDSHSMLGKSFKLQYNKSKFSALMVEAC